MKLFWLTYSVIVLFLIGFMIVIGQLLEVFLSPTLAWSLAIAPPLIVFGSTYIGALHSGADTFVDARKAGFALRAIVYTLLSTTITLIGTLVLVVIMARQFFG